MKRYNKFKNIMLAAATAYVYYGCVVDGVGAFNKIFATVCIFALVLIVLRDADRAAIERAKERRRKKVAENA